MSFPETPGSFVDSSLGLDTLRQSDNESAAVEHYWQRVHSRLHGLRDSGREPAEQLILLGESAVDDEFLATLKAALDAIGSPLVSHLGEFALGRTIFDDNKGKGVIDPLFAPALGAAEIMKRIVEAPRGCFELPECLARRQDLKE